MKPAEPILSSSSSSTQPCGVLSSTADVVAATTTTTTTTTSSSPHRLRASVAAFYEYEVSGSLHQLGDSPHSPSSPRQQTESDKLPPAPVQSSKVQFALPLTGEQEVAETTQDDDKDDQKNAQKSSAAAPAPQSSSGRPRPTMARNLSIFSSLQQQPMSRTERRRHVVTAHDTPYAMGYPTDGRLVRPSAIHRRECFRIHTLTHS